MVYPDQLEEKLGFDQIRRRLSENCLSPAAMRRVDAMRFLTDYDAIRVLLSQTLEFVRIIEKGESFPTAHFHDPVQWHDKIFPPGNYLEEQELLDMAGALETVGLCKSFLQRSREWCTSLRDRADPVPPTPGAAEKRNTPIAGRARVRDSRPPKVARIRPALRDNEPQSRTLSQHRLASAL